ncbi:septum formation protein [Sedimentibacter acidaminivorans]|jgi:nucleoside triphosphate pyrophosphatase|uniref:dTTP/UTP pyrophosphatase n=1 Tax=Sedimentibacter acidaminivorans TaxID=913099 RepID=A0ABS4GC16_9FIRM|nr:nucleoside triphosphate pyrophosphatase [Sedimentibacter acidaminivorans]MBP1924945.1 septum formation protein [Sedimentibacter acidaminivorans]
MKKIILASKSPRRIEMLSKYFKDIKVYSSEVQEIVNPNDKPQTTVMKIAFEKASAGLKLCDEHGIIIAADTIVYMDEVMGKPNNIEEGFQMLKDLSGKKHSVFTGICIIDTISNKKVVDFEKTEVVFNELSDNEILKYLDLGEYIDKAGSYGIQGYGELLVKKIDGCYNNVKGLPLSKLNYLLKKHFSLELL